MTRSGRLHTRARLGVVAWAVVATTALVWPGVPPSRPRPAPPAAVEGDTIETIPPTTSTSASPSPTTSGSASRLRGLPAPVAAARLAAIVERALADPRLAGTTVGLSVFVEGLGEIAVHNPDLPLKPASTQKLYTAMGALATLDPGFAFATEVRATGSLDDGILRGDLVLVGGGDPTLLTRGPHSLETLASAVKRAGVERVDGSLIGDDSRYDDSRNAPGWYSWHVPGFVGPLSALTVARNQHRSDASFVTDPVPTNLALFRAALARRGITVAGQAVADHRFPGSRVLASVRSVPLTEIVADMLTRSDNTAAELLLKEVGFQERGRGATAEGVEAVDAALRVLGVPLLGTSRDGSGLSRADLRSAREWRRLLQAARTQPWGAGFIASLPLAGRTGTLTTRFRGTAAEANLRAKTGRILEGRALSGYLTTAGGREIVFSIVVNGTNPHAPVESAIDDLMAALAGDDS